MLWVFALNVVFSYCILIHLRLIFALKHFHYFFIPFLIEQTAFIIVCHFIISIVCFGFDFSNLQLCISLVIVYCQFLRDRWLIPADDSYFHI